MRTHALLWRLCVGILLFSSGLMLAGCGKGSSLGTVSGKVTYKGQPLKGGNVSIIPTSGSAVGASIEPDGSYKITKVPLGTAKITVETQSLRPMDQKALPGPYSRAPKEALPSNVQGDASRYVPIPNQYAKPDESGLSIDVKSGENPHDIDLK